MKEKIMHIPELHNNDYSFMEVLQTVGKPTYIKNIKKKENFNIISLFSGAGGMDLGFKKAGFITIFANDFDKDACETYSKNIDNNIICKSITDISNNEIIEKIKDKEVDVVIGGPPCQGFSLAGNIGRKFADDPRNHLFNEFLRVVQVTNPKVFVMENVARLYSHNYGKTRQEIIDKFSQIGYHVKCFVVNAADFGVPQNRRRIIIIGSKKDLTIKLTTPKHNTKTVFDAIGDLPVLENGQECKSVPNHTAMKHTEQMLKKMSFIKNGGSRNDIPNDIRPTSGDVRKYIRYDSEKPSHTVTGDMRKIFHYSQNRALTVRELARLQSFDDNFVFCGNSISQQQQVGNAVPPLMAHEIAKQIKEMLKKYD
jgi:DNA (cytosine-5)-methyltransferase 1